MMLPRRGAADVSTLVLLAALVLAIYVVGDRCYQENRVETYAITFNIENCCNTKQQLNTALTEIATSGAHVVALQEIMKLPKFERAVREQLGDHWQVRWQDKGTNRQKVGILFDTRIYQFERSHTFTEIALGRDGLRPALQVTLRHRPTGERHAFISVHLKAGNKKNNQDDRARQLQYLAPIVNAAKEGHELVAVLGDFNTVVLGDRLPVYGFVDATGLQWATVDVRCTHYWKQKNPCGASPLDHILISRKPRTPAKAIGICEKHGCDLTGECPYWPASDHCPVRIGF